MTHSIPSFSLLETTIGEIHEGYRSGQLTARQLVQSYLERIEMYDKRGPFINAVITINPQAIEEARRLDAVFKASGFVGSLHGIPLVFKDQADVKGMPTTLGSILFKDYYPDQRLLHRREIEKSGRDYSSQDNTR